MTEQHRASIEALLAAQQAYWQQLTGAGAGNADQSGQEPKEQQRSAQADSEQAQQKAPPQFAQLMEILQAQAANFSEYGESLLQQYQSGDLQTNHAAMQQFQDYIRQQTNNQLMQQWQIPQQFGALFKSANATSDTTNNDNPLIDALKSLLDKPVAGVHQAQQQQIQEAIKLTLDYQEALQAYSEHYNGIGEQASKVLIDALQENDQQIEGLQQLHDLWTNAYETAYVETIATSAYQQAHGRISNAFTRLKKCTQDVRDSQFQQVGLATRQGLDTALERQHQLRKNMRQTQRQLGQMQAQLDHLDPNLLLATIAELRQEVDSLKQQVTLLQTADKKLKKSDKKRHNTNKN